MNYQGTTILNYHCLNMMNDIQQKCNNNHHKKKKNGKNDIKKNHLIVKLNYDKKKTIPVVL